MKTNPHPSIGARDGSFNRGLNFTDTKINNAAISLLGTGNGATLIEYDANDYEYFDRVNNRKPMVIGGAVKGGWTPNGPSIGSATTYNAWLFIESSTTAKAHLRLYPGGTPSTPGDGDVWFDGTDVEIRVGGVVKTFALA